MHIYSAQDIIKALPYDRLVRDLPPLLLRNIVAPQRHVHTIQQSGEPDATLLIMPAWGSSAGGVKIVNVTPGNSARGLAAVTASYLLFDGVTGEHKALLDGGELTARRTAAVAAVAAARLAVDSAHRLLLIGSGRIATELAYAFRAVRPINEVVVHSPTRANAERLVARLKADGFGAAVCENLEATARQADLIASATLSTEPIVKGEWLKPGQHVSLIGGYTPAMREADDHAMARAEVWIDTPAGLNEAGDLIEPIMRGLLQASGIKGTLQDLCAQAPVANRDGVITLFKSVGDASQDLAAAAIALSPSLT